jgi:hypothetical protein
VVAFGSGFRDVEGVALWGDLIKFGVFLIIF